MDTVGSVVGENIRRLRTQARWTQEQAALRVAAKGLDWRRTHIADLESGRRETLDIGSLVVLADVFGVTLPDLLAGDGEVLLAPVRQQPWSVATSRRQLRHAVSGDEFIVLPLGDPPKLPCAQCGDVPPRGFTCNTCSATG